MLQPLRTIEYKCFLNRTWHAYLVYFFNLGTCWPFWPLRTPSNRKDHHHFAVVSSRFVSFFPTNSSCCVLQVFSSPENPQLEYLSPYDLLICWKNDQECEGNILLMEEILHQLVGGFSVSPFIYRGFSTIPGGMVWDFFHQHWGPQSQESSAQTLEAPT